MTILINTQAFHSDMLFDEIVLLSKNEDIKLIYIISSLMHDLDSSIVTKYNSIDKVNFIKTTTLFSDTEFKNVDFNLNRDSFDKEEYLHTDILSSYRWMPISNRKENDMISFSMRFYYDIYNFWDNFFKEKKIDCVIQLNEEHSSLDSILIRSAKENNVKNIITSRIVGAFSAKNEEYHAFYDNVNGKYLNLNEYKINSTKSTKLDIHSDFVGYSKKYKAKEIDKIIYQLNRFLKLIKQNESIKYRLLNLLKIIKNKLISKILLTQQYYFLKNLRKYYLDISEDNVDFDKKYIYYCLHFDPEANTLPKDNGASNQLLNLRILSSSLPDDWIIYVKEHPHQLQYKLYKNIFMNQLHSVDNFRSKSFYNYIKTIKNVKLISLNANHKKLIEKSQIIASNTGTIFREANYLKKNCFTFSNKSIYNHLENVYFINDKKSCVKSISDCFSTGIIEESKVDSLFANYSITIIEIKNRTGEIFKFMNENRLYEINND